MNRLCVDLCSGLGGFSEAFVDAGWDVIRIDNDERFKTVPHTVIADICDVEAIKKIVKLRRVTVVLASPPCERFSFMGNPWPRAGIGKALAIVGACLEVIVALEPDYWVLENPKARLRWFLKTPKTNIRLIDFGGRLPKPTDLWGNVQLPLLKSTVPPFKGHGPTERRRLGVPMIGSDAAENAKIPYGLSEAILEAVT